MPGCEILGKEEIREVMDVLESGVLFRYANPGSTEKSKASLLEQALTDRLRIKYSHVCSSGTSALSIALAAAGIGAGDEVIVPPFTFIATIEAVLLAGAIPVFAEIDETLCLDPQSVAAAITPRTQAVIAVHMCGGMARIDELAQLCNQRQLCLIEDTAQALGASFQGQALGTFGQLGCFSFDSVKTITCGEGGAVVTRQRELYERAAQYSDHGHDHLGDNRGLDQHPVLGTNYRLSELNAAVGLAQIRKLEKMIEIQRRHKARLKEALGQYSDVSFRHLPDPAGDSATFLTFLLPDESAARSVRQDLAQRGFPECVFWFDNTWHYVREWDHLQRLRSCGKLTLHLLASVPDYDSLELPRSDSIMARAVSLQIKLSWTTADLDRRLSAIDECFKSRGSQNVQESSDGHQSRVRSGSFQPARQHPR